MEYPRFPLYYEKYSVFNLLNNNIEAEFINSIYPRDLLELRHIIEDECEKLDFTGSMIYDEFPDKVMINKKCGEIASYALLNSSYGKKNKDISRLKDIICILFTDEITKRRSMHKNYLR